jgi:hypothetical protein
VEGTIHPPKSERQNTAQIADMLRQRGLRIARVSKQDAAENEAVLSGYRRLLKDRPEDIRRFGIQQPHELTEGQLVLVALENDRPAVYLLGEAMIAGERRRLMEHVAKLDLARLPDISGAALALRNSAKAAAVPVTSSALDFLTPKEREFAARQMRPEVPAKESQADDIACYLGPGDLARRWHYTKQGVQKLARREDFPAPLVTVNRGRIRLWAKQDIERYERDRPELHSEAAKFLKVRGFARALRKGAQQPTG